MLSETHTIKERNRLIIKAYQEGYSQHMIAKVLNISQPAVYGVIKRGSKK
jgi:putative transposase